MMLTACDLRDQPRLARARVLLDGVDVTDICFGADEAHGVAVLYRLDADGHKHLSWAPCGHRERVVGCLCEHFRQAVQAEVAYGVVELRGAEVAP